MRKRQIIPKKIFTPNHILEYSKCPKKALSSWDFIFKESPLINKDSLVLSNVIRSVYLFSERKGYYPKWKWIPRWLDRSIKKFITEGLLTQKEYTETKNMLTRLYKWYHSIFLSEPRAGITNVPILGEITPYLYWQDKIDILCFDPDDQGVTVVDFVETKVDPNPRILYNDFIVRSRIWGVEKFLGVKVTGYQRICFVRKRIATRFFSMSPEVKERGRKYINNIIRGVANNQDYPSVTEQCLSCTYSHKCSI